ncbi:putative Mini-chromosome maintenance complex-binding protein, partial [Naja naja]
PHQEIDLNPKQIVTSDRQTFYCVPVPGESAASQARVCPSTSYTPSRHKRSYEDDEDMELHPSKQREQHLGNVPDIQGSGEPKRLETEASARHQMISLNCSSPLDLNFPLPGEKGPACLVK